MATMYGVYNTVRGRQNRSQRAAAPIHHRLKQVVGVEQSRVVRGRPLIITEDRLLRDIDELKMKSRLGVLEVRTLDGRKFDLETLTAVSAGPSAPLPNPPLDSISNDLPAGIPMATLPGGKTPGTLPDYTPEEDAPPDGEEVHIPADFLPEESEEVDGEVTEPAIPAAKAGFPTQDRGGRGRRR